MILQKRRTVSAQEFSPDWETSKSTERNTNTKTALQSSFKGIREILELPLCTVFCLVAATCTLKDYFSFSSRLSLTVSIILFAIAAAGLIAIIRVNRRLFIGTTVLVIFSFILMHCNSRIKESAYAAYDDGEVISVAASRYSNRVRFYSGESKGMAICYTTFPVSENGTVIYHSLRKIEADSAYQRSLIRDGIEHTARCTHARRSKGGFLFRLRDDFDRKITLVFGKNGCAAFLKAVLIAEKNDISKRAMLQYRRAGLLHILAASGMHVGIISGGILLAGAYCINRRDILLLISSVALLGYLLITAVPVSLLRACIMFWILTFCYITRIRSSGLNSLFLTALIISVFSPAQLFSAGFQLSFLATGGILVFYRPISKKLPSLPFHCEKLLALSLSAQLFVSPLLFLLFSEHNAAGLISGMLCVPLLSIFINAAILTLLLSFISGTAALYTGKACTLLYELINRLITFIASLPLHLRTQSVLPLLAFLVLLLCITCSAALKKKHLFLLIALYALFFTFFSHRVIESHSTNQSLHFDGKTMIIEGNIDRQSINKIEQIVINRMPDSIIVIAGKEFFHCRKDYYSLFKRIEVDTLVINRKRLRTLSHAFRDLIEEEGIRIVAPGKKITNPDGLSSSAKIPDFGLLFCKTELKKILEF